MIQIKNLRQQRKLHQIKVARDLGIPMSTMSRWEQGHHEPSIANILKLADYFDVSTDELLGRYEEHERDD